MPSPLAVTVSKNALEELSKAAIEFDVRPHELVDAIVAHTNWESQVEKVVRIISEDRKKGVGSRFGSGVGSLSGPSEARNRSLSVPSRI
jgi:hypothetical protein